MYLTWSGYFEGTSDFEYFQVILHRIMSILIETEGIRPVLIPEVCIRFGRHDRSVEAVSKEACDSRQAFHLWYVHADTGGRNLSTGIDNRSEAYKQRAHQLCELPLERTIIIAPRKETEAWVLADRDAVLSAFGVSTNVDLTPLPGNAAACEKLDDPKKVLSLFATRINKRRYRYGASSLYPSIAQKQRIERLRDLASFRAFEENLRIALISLGCIARR